MMTHIIGCNILQLYQYEYQYVEASWNKHYVLIRNFEVATYYMKHYEF